MKSTHSLSIWIKTRQNENKHFKEKYKKLHIVPKLYLKELVNNNLDIFGKKILKSKFYEDLIGIESSSQSFWKRFNKMCKYKTWRDSKKNGRKFYIIMPSRNECIKNFKFYLEHITDAPKRIKEPVIHKCAKCPYKTELKHNYNVHLKYHKKIEKEKKDYISLLKSKCDENGKLSIYISEQEKKINIDQPITVCIEPCYLFALYERKYRKTLSVRYFSDFKIVSKDFSYKNRDIKEAEIERQSYIQNIQRNVKTDTKTIKFCDINPTYLTKYFNYVEPIIHYPEQKVPFDPYIIGAWLGDGTKNSPIITNQDAEIIIYLKKTLPNYNLYLQYNDRYNYRFNQIFPKNRGRYYKNSFKTMLKSLNLYNNKHIPDIYKYNSLEVRLQVLAGLIDTDGSLSRHYYEISQKRKILSKDIIELARSCGYFVKVRKKKVKWIYKGKTDIREYFRIFISLYYHSKSIPVKIKRKKFDVLNETLFLPKIKLESKNRIIWTNELDNLIKQTVQKYHKKFPKNKRYDWDWILEEIIKKNKIFTLQHKRNIHTRWVKTITQN